MSRPQHTPGPWTLSTDARGYDIVTGANGSQVLKGTMCMVTDARLIAAAPEMLAVLQAVADYWAGGDVPAELDAQMRAVIAKATGAA